MALRRWHCNHCAQTFVGSNADVCSLCNKTGGLVELPELPSTNHHVPQEPADAVKPAPVMETASLTSGNSLRWLVIGVVLLLFAGGAWFLYDLISHRDAFTRNQLKRIYMAYNSYGDVMRGRAPGKLEDLHPYLHGETWPLELGQADQVAYQAMVDGKFTVVWGVKDYQKAKEGTGLLLAYETKAKQSSGYAIFADYRIERLSSEQLDKAIKETPTE